MIVIISRLFLPSFPPTDVRPPPTKIFAEKNILFSCNSRSRTALTSCFLLQEQGGVEEELCKEACGEWHGCVHLRSQHAGQEKPSFMVFPQSTFICVVPMAQVYHASFIVCSRGWSREDKQNESKTLFWDPPGPLRQCERCLNL